VTGFHIQDPSEAGRTLLDVLAEAGDGAERGGGIFAFASERGVAMLLDDPVMTALTKSGTFDLVVGVDAITNPRALVAMGKRASRRNGLSARVLLHDLPILFHPKLCWFVEGGELTLVLGSGNLTPGGLTNNFEAFTVTSYGPPTAAAVEAQITAWLTRWEQRLLATDAPEAVERAKQNSGAERSLRRPMPPEPEEAEPPPPGGDELDGLVAEITRNAPARTQVDIGKEQYSTFFGGEPKRKKRIRIQHVGPGDILGEIELRPLIETQSDNYRFEAGGRGRRGYPADGRPYRLLWPGEPGHADLEAFLTAEQGADGVRRHPTDVASLRAAWPDSPF
jgi:hypothetical protein